MRFIGVVVSCAVLLGAAGLCWAQGDDPLAVAGQQIVEKFTQAAQAKQGTVAALDTTATPATLYVTLGSKDGVLEGTILSLFAKGAPIVVEGATVGYIQTPVGMAEVTQVQNENLCAAVVKKLEKNQQPAVGNAAYTKSVPATLAVYGFLRPDNAGTQMGIEFADRLGMALQGSGKFKVVERTRLEQALGELKLGLNDLFNPQKAAPLGQLIQAQGIVVGTITQQNAGYTINARVVDIATGVQVATASTTCGRSTDLDAKYAKVLGTPGPTGPGPVPPAAGTVTKPLGDKTLTWARGAEPGREENRSVGGRLWDSVLYMGGGNAYTLKLDGRWRSLTMEIGVKDNTSSHRDVSKLQILLDGDLVKEVVVRKDSKPITLTIDLTGMASLQFRPIDDDVWVNAASVLTGDAPTDDQ